MLSGSRRPSRRCVLLAGAALGFAALAQAAPSPRRAITKRLSALHSPFILGCNAGGITSLRFRGDRFDTDYVRAGGLFGQVRARFRRGEGPWETIDTRDDRRGDYGRGTASTSAVREGVTLTSQLSLEEDALFWRIVLRNDGKEAIEVGDLMLPLPMDTRFAAGRAPTEAVLKHSFVSGHGSHIFWMRSNSAGPYLLMLPDRSSALEYWDRRRLVEGEEESWCAFIHAAAAAAETAAEGNDWRRPVTSLHVAPGAEHSYAFRFIWVRGYAEARDAIAAAGLIDVEVVPGMTVPSDMHVDIALRSSDPIERIEAEFPDDTAIEPLPPRSGCQLFRVRFVRLGENRLTLHQPGGRRTHLEFFACEPIETLLGKRAAFIARRQHRDPSKWYDGLFGEWNMESQMLLGPDNYDRIGGWRIYAVTCDDPGLSKPAFLAIKNAEFPDAKEVAALDHYIETFVWGGLQRSTGENHPYAIYGIPDWKQNRESPDPGPKGRQHYWRPYDYPHIFATYFAMYRVARDHREIPTRLTAREYLERAFGTARAMFTIPMEVTGWSAYRTGFYNECVIPDLAAALDEEGMTGEAAELRHHWARKVHDFVAGDVDLFGSEYPFDSTGFESTQALARSALDTPRAMGVTRVQAEEFARRQIDANLFCRGWLEPSYYYLGSDYRAQAGDSYTLTYMAQMGGWALLDHALHDAADPFPLLRLGYASQLSAFALINSGPADTGHGYWYPGEANDGAAAGGYEPASRGMTWLDQPHHGGAWYYACEIDLGFCGAVRAAATIVADDPLFGSIALGGRLVSSEEGRVVFPADGVRRRLHLRSGSGGFDLILHGARFRAGHPVRIAVDGRSARFRVERFDPAQPFVEVERRLVGGSRQRARVALAGDEIVVHFGSETDSG